MKNRYIWMIFLLMSLTLALYAQNGDNSAEQQFEQAVNAYSANDWATSYQRFYDILVTHPEYDNFEVNFNLGSCCFKMGRIGEARYYFERALMYKPFDADLYHNLEVIYQRIYDSPEMGLQNVHSKRALFLVGRQVLIPLLLVLIILTVTMFSLFYLTHGKRGFGIMALLFFLLSAASFIWFGIQRADFNRNVYVVKVQQTDVYLSPTDPDSVLMTLSEGAKGSVIENTGTFIKIRIPDGTSGYIKRSAVISSDEF